MEKKSASLSPGIESDDASLFRSPQSVDGGNTVRVYARIKPLLPNEEEGEEDEKMEPRIFYSGNEIVANPPGVSSYRQHFSFSRLFPPSVDQSTLFNEMVLPRLKAFLLGTNQLLFTYGASSSGKTYTVQGTASNPGILPRSLDLIFNSLGPSRFVEQSPLQPSGFDSVTVTDSYDKILEEKNQVLSLGRLLNDEEEEIDDVSHCTNSSAQSLATMFPNLRHRERENTKIQGFDYEGVYYSLWVSFAEIYNENIYDLFEKMPLLAKKEKPRRRPLRLAEDRRGRIYIKGLQEVQVSTADEAYQLLLIGRKNLQFAATKLNHNSSRSHCIFTIKIMKFCDLKEPRYGRVSILSFCDLAGSERIKKMHTDGKRQKETVNINTSLLVLGRVMKALKDNQSQKDSKKLAMVVPYRDSKLTRLLQVFFKGIGQASMIVNISQSPYLFDETLQALKFAAITSKINYVRESSSSTKTKRRSTFSSIMLQQKRNSNLVGRGSIVWENPVISSTICPPNTNDDREEEADYPSVVSSVEDQYEALTNLVEELKEKLNEEKQKNLTLESDIRTELCNEFNSMMVKNEQQWQKRLQDTTELIEDLGEWRLTQMENAYKESRKRKRYEEKDEKGLSSHIATLESELEGKNVELEENNKQLKVMKETHSSLLNARQKLQEELTSIKFENTRFKSQVERLKDDILSLSKENKSKELAIESLTESPIIIDLRGQLSDVKKKLTKKNEEVTYLKKLLDEAGEEYLTKDDEVQKLTSELDSLKAESAQLASELKDAQHEHSVLISESNHRQEEKEQLEEQVIGCRTEITELLAEKSQLILELSNLKNEKLSSCQKLERDVILKDSKETEKELNRRILELENENKKIKFNFEESKNQYEIRIEDLQSTLQNAMDTSEALLVKNKDLKSKISLLESEVSVLGSLPSPPRKEKPKSILQDISVLETKEFETFERNVITEELESSKKLLDEKNNLIEEKEKIILEKDNLITSKSKELADANKAIEEIKGKTDQDVKSLNTKMEEKELYIHQLEDIIVDKNYEITQVEEQLSQLKKKECEENLNVVNDDIKEKLEKEISSLQKELDHCKSASETLDKTLKKTLEEKDRKEKDLNDEIENLRQSKIKVKSSDDLKTKQLLEKDNEIDSLEKEIKLRIQTDRQHEQRIEELNSEIKILERQIKKLNEDSKDIEVLGKKIGEQQNLIDSLQNQLKTKEKEDNMIEILKEELELKNSERSQLMHKISKLESYSIDSSELEKLQEKVSRLEVEAQSKDEEIKQTREEREDAMNNFSKLIKAKEDELVRLKQESTRIRDVIIRSSPNKNLRNELEKREATIKDLEEKVEKTMDVEAESQDNYLKNEVDNLKCHITRTNAKHSREIEKLKKAHNKMLKEYKDANRELQKQLGHSSNLSDESIHQSMLDADESLDASLEESSCKSIKTKRKGKTRSTRKKSRATVSSTVSPVSSNLGESLFENPINEESTVGDENVVPYNTTCNSSRITRSTRKTKKKSVYSAVVDNLETNSPKKERRAGTLKEVANSEMSSENTMPEATPRRSARRPLYNPGKLEAFSPVADLSETATSPHTIVKRQLRTRKKK